MRREIILNKSQGFSEDIVRCTIKNLINPSMFGKYRFLQHFKITKTDCKNKNRFIHTQLNLTRCNNCISKHCLAANVDDYPRSNNETI